MLVVDTGELVTIRIAHIGHEEAGRIMRTDARRAFAGAAMGEGGRVKGWPSKGRQIAKLTPPS
jgi:hypothetical protein